MAKSWGDDDEGRGKTKGDGKSNEDMSMTDLQMHAAFFDTNKDGIVYPWDIFAGFRRLGFNVVVSTLGAVIIAGAFSYRTQQDKHGSDTGNYDYQGRFVEDNFEKIMKKYAKSQPDKLTLGEIWRMTEDHRLIANFFGWVAAKLEFGILYILAKDDDGFLPKEAFYQVYNGTLFDNMANKNKEKKKHK